MEYRDLGSSGLRVSVIGMGTWAIGGRTPGNTSYGHMDDRASRDAVRAAVEAGITFFDTANIYGQGHAEEILGEALGSDRKRVVVASKCGMGSIAGDKDFSAAALRRSVEGSLRRLGTDHLDLLQLHDPSPDLADDPELLATMSELMASGKVVAVGVSVKSPVEGLSFLNGRWHSVQCNFNMIDLRAADCGLIDAAAAAGVGIIARTPLAFGFLSDRFDDGPPVFAEGDHRARWSAEQIRLWLDAPRHFAPFATAAGRSMAQLAISFCKDFPGVTATIPGSTTRTESQENAAVGSLPRLEEETLAAITAAARSRRFFLS